MFNYCEHSEVVGQNIFGKIIPIPVKISYNKILLQTNGRKKGIFNLGISETT